MAEEVYDGLGRGVAPSFITGIRPATLFLAVSRRSVGSGSSETPEVRSARRRGL